MLESLEKLRKYKLFDEGKRLSAYLPSDKLADEIEAEISERYMPLPVDADGVPIHVGDEITLPNGSRDKVRFITIREHDVVFNERGWVPNRCTHAKPRTLEDVLIDAMQFGFSSHAGDDVSEKAREFADEIRELLGGDAS